MTRYVMFALVLLLPAVGVAETKQECIAAARKQKNAAKQAAAKEFQAAKSTCRTQSGGGGGGAAGCCVYTQSGFSGCAIGVTAQECATGDLENGNFPAGTFVAFGSSFADPVDPAQQKCCIAPSGKDKGNCGSCP